MFCPKCRKDRVIYTETEFPFIKKRICTKCGHEEFEVKEFIIKEEQEMKKLTIECVDNTTLIFEIPNDFPIEKIINSSSDWVEINNTFINIKNIEYFKIEEIGE